MGYIPGDKHTKILLLCLVFTVIYVFLYGSITFRTATISHMMKTALDDLDVFKHNVEQMMNIDFQTNKNNKDINDSISDDVLNNTIPGEKILLVLFTTFTSKPEKYVCRNNTVNNWASLAPFVKSIFFSDDEDLSNRVRKAGWDVMLPKTSSIGVPILKFMYLDVMKKYNAHFYGYSNGDLLFTHTLVKTLLKLKPYSEHPMLIVGQRTNVRDVTESQASSHENITLLAKKGKLFTPWGEDYFITDSKYPWKDCPEVVIGRVAYDNFLVLNARKHKHTTVDATRTLLALHQTTKAGDSEGHKHPNGNFNNRLLGRLYKRINYAAGLTSCTSYYTALNGSHIQMIQRKVNKHCFPL